MKSILIIVAILIASVANAEPVRSVGGASIDLPKLIKFSDDVSIGLEGGKDIVYDLWHNEDTWLDDDKGYWGYIKVTANWSVLDFSK